MKHTTDVLVVGGGAAGLMAAIVAGQRGRKVVVLEHNERVGKKILISGGGRCNFTNLGAGPDQYLSRQPDFCRSALARYSPDDFLALVEKHGIAYHEKKLGQQFCDLSSKEIVGLLLAEAQEASVKIVTNCRPVAVDRSDTFRVQTAESVWESDSLIIATGGLSFPPLGASDFGYSVARQFGLSITEVRPGLVPLLHTDEYRDRLAALSGVSLPVRISFGGQTFAENLLFTHRGISGPAVLQISSYWREGDRLSIDLLPGLEGLDWLLGMRNRDGKLVSRLQEFWPRRFAEAWCDLWDLSRPLAQLPLRQLTEAGRALNNWQLPFSRTEGYAKAEVTVGGIDTAEINSKTMESRRIPGLYFVGEVLDVTGWLGGYNFQWAWASGHAAGLVA